MVRAIMKISRPRETLQVTSLRNWNFLKMADLRSRNIERAPEVIFRRSVCNRPKAKIGFAITLPRSITAENEKKVASERRDSSLSRVSGIREVRSLFPEHGSSICGLGGIIFVIGRSSSLNKFFASRRAGVNPLDCHLAVKLGPTCVGEEKKKEKVTRFLLKPSSKTIVEKKGGGERARKKGHNSRKRWHSK